MIKTVSDDKHFSKIPGKVLYFCSGSDSLVPSFKYYLQHKRPCCISIYKLEPKARVVYLIQHGRECCK